VLSDDFVFFSFGRMGGGGGGDGGELDLSESEQGPIARL